MRATETVRRRRDGKTKEACRGGAVGGRWLLRRTGRGCRAVKASLSLVRPTPNHGRQEGPSDFGKEPIGWKPDHLRETLVTPSGQSPNWTSGLDAIAGRWCDDRYCAPSPRPRTSSPASQPARPRSLSQPGLDPSIHPDEDKASLIRPGWRGIGASDGMGLAGLGGAGERLALAERMAWRAGWSATSCLGSEGAPIPACGGRLLVASLGTPGSNNHAISFGGTRQFPPPP